jgi:hypothetical protein
MRRSLWLSAACSALLPLPCVRAEEGGTGHYLPGSIASFVDAVPPTPTFVARLNGIYYDGSSGGALPIAGLAPVNVEAQSYAAGLTLLWRPKLELAPGLSYAMSTTVPYVWLEVRGDVTAGATTVRRSSSENGLGDLVLMPVMLSYALSRDAHLDFRTGIYAPTGDYEVGRLANTGKNFWTFEPTLGFLYFGQKNGFEASVYVGMDFNTENEATSYQSGSQFHLDGTLAQHFKLLGGLGGIGVTGFWYDQLTGDSGAGATFGDFKAQTAGLGPVLSYVCKVGGKDLITEIKWLHEVETRYRLEGDFVWLKVIFKF